jgi:hypothetical protein
MAPATAFIVKFRKATPARMIAARQLDALRGYLRPRDKKLRLSDVKELFELMRK